MNRKTIEFPQYRKMINDKAFYKISNDKEFTEIQIIGNNAILHNVIAEKYPEMLRIQDMLQIENEWIVKILAEEYNSLLTKYSL